MQEVSRALPKMEFQQQPKQIEEDLMDIDEIIRLYKLDCNSSISQSLPMSLIGRELKEKIAS